MLQFTVRRLIAAVPTLFAVLAMIFVIIRIVPGDPAVAILGDAASAETLANLRERLGLNEPIYMQFATFIVDFLRGNLGTSLVSGRPVIDEVFNALPYTIDLTVAAIAIGVFFGIPFGILAAVYRNGAVDYVSRIGSLLGLSFPAFYTAILLILLFSIQFDWFPVISEGDLGNPAERLYHLVLPAFSLGLIMVAYVTRATRSSMLEVLGEDYIRTAKAKGLHATKIVMRHALRNALIPIVTVIGLYLGLLIGNSVLTEIVFNRPGLGKLIVGALEQRDYGMLQGLMVVYGVFIVITNTITDLSYGLVDPRVKHQ